MPLLESGVDVGNIHFANSPTSAPVTSGSWVQLPVGGESAFTSLHHSLPSPPWAPGRRGRKQWGSKITQERVLFAFSSSLPADPPIPSWQSPSCCHQPLCWTLLLKGSAELEVPMEQNTEKTQIHKEQRSQINLGANQHFSNNGWR